MKNCLYLPVFACLLLCSGACSRYYYMPNSMLIPAVQKQHDAAISIATCRYDGREIQAFYSPLKYVLLTFNDMYIPGAPDSRSVIWRGNGRIREFGGGVYYGKYPWTLSLLGGAGSGFAENFYERDVIPATSRLDFQQWFIQPGFALQTRNFRFAIAVKQVWLHYTKGEIDKNINNSRELKAIKRIEENPTFHPTELGLSLGFRIRPFTLSVNRVGIISGHYQSTHFETNNLNLLLTLDLFELWRWKDTPRRKSKMVK